VKLSASNVLAFLVGLVALVGAIVLTAIHDTVPTYVWAIAFAGLTAGAGLSIPAGQTPALSLTEVAETLPKLLATFPAAVKVEDVAREVLHQLVGAITPPAVVVPTPIVTPEPPAAVTPVDAAAALGALAAQTTAG
jgi:hypothetical protein